METLDFYEHKVVVRRRAYQRRLSVSVRVNGEVRVSANRSLGQRHILRFLEKNKGWIEKAIQENLRLVQSYPPKVFQSGESYPYLGKDYTLELVQSSFVGLQFSDDKILFSILEKEEELSSQRRAYYLDLFKQKYREVAETLMMQRLQHFSEQMKLYPRSVHFRAQKTIWGSCTAQNKINLNFKLIIAPLEVIDYVIIHELAHIQHKNHSAQFWGLVERYTEHRHSSKRWLSEHQFKADFLAKKSELR